MERDLRRLLDSCPKLRDGLIRTATQEEQRPELGVHFRRVLAHLLRCLEGGNALIAGLWPGAIDPGHIAIDARLLQLSGQQPHLPPDDPQLHPVRGLLRGEGHSGFGLRACRAVRALGLQSDRELMM